MAPKYQIVADMLRTDILDGAYQKRMMLPTEQVLCQRFQVSRQTVRQALSLLASEGLIERRQGSGSHIVGTSPAASAPRRSIAIVTTYISDYIFPSILREAENVLSENNSAPLLFVTQNQVANERRVLDTLLHLPALDGVLVEGTKTVLPNPNLDLYRELIDRGIPLVFMNGNYTELHGSLSVLDDNYGGSQMLVHYLHGRGHSRIAGVFKNDDIQGHQRYAGYADTLRAVGLPFEDRQVYWYNTEEKETLFADGASARFLDQTLKDYSAVVCYNDEIAMRLVGWAVKRGIEIPEELAVVSFDNSKFSEMTVPRITSLSHGANNVGRLAAELLIKKLAGEPCQSQVAPWILVEKESS